MPLSMSKTILRKAELADCDRANELHHETKDWSRHTLTLMLAIALNDRERMEKVIANQRRTLAQLQRPPTPAAPKESAGMAMLRRAGILPPGPKQNRS